MRLIAMMFAITLVFVFNFITVSPASAQSLIGVESQERVVQPTYADTDDGMLWIAMRLIDKDRQPGNNIVHDPWIVQCNDWSPTSLEEGMLVGFSQNNPEQPARDLRATECERYLELNVSGTINGEHVARRELRWQPGPNASRWIGVVRNKTTDLTLEFPEVFTVDEWIFRAMKPVEIKMSGHERFIVVDVPLRRHSMLELACDECGGLDTRSVVNSNAYWISENVGFVKPWTHTLVAPKGFSIRVKATDARDETHFVTPIGTAFSSYELDARFGWSYQVELVQNPGLRQAELPLPEYQSEESRPNELASAKPGS